MSELTDKLREGVKLRFNRVPLEDFIRMCQQAADRIDELEAQAKQPVIVRQFCTMHRGDAIANAPAPNYRVVCPSCEAFHAQE